jgi:hypothetical protein
MRQLARGTFLAVLLVSWTQQCWSSDWTKDDTYRQAAVTALLAMDWAQTRYIAKSACADRGGGADGSPPLLETGLAHSFIGSRPSIGRVNNYFAASVVWNAAVSYMLPPELRRGWQYVSIGFELGYVASNRSIGIKMEF